MRYLIRFGGGRGSADQTSPIGRATPLSRASTHDFQRGLKDRGVPRNVLASFKSTRARSDFADLVALADGVIPPHLDARIRHRIRVSDSKIN